MLGMGSVINRGSRSRPNWYLKYKTLEGKWKWVSSKQPTKAKARQLLNTIEARIAAGKAGIEEAKPDPLCGELLTEWAAGLRNRDAANDRSRLRNHVFPVFSGKKMSEVTLKMTMGWIDQQRAAGKLADATIRHNLNLLSRFFSWAIERGHADFNPVRQIPTGKRPQATQKTDTPWLNDEKLVAKIIRAFRSPLHYMFYLGNRSGMRTGEISGVRMSDFDFLDESVIRLRFSYNGPLKEDKDNRGKIKWVPAADNCKEFLGPWLAQRAADGAGPEDLVFPGPRFPERPCRKEYIEGHWERIRDQFALGNLTWYQATRHSFTSRLLAAGASLDEVSAALGHSSPVVTRRYYDHFIRRSYSKTLRGDIDLDELSDDGASTTDTDEEL